MATDLNYGLRMERLHLRVIENSIDVLYRPTHTYLTFLNNDEEGIKELKRLATMPRDEFAIYLKSHLHSRLSKSSIEYARNSKLEEWYLNAWKSQTDRLFKEIGIENPIEEVILFDDDVVFQ